jgi:subtilisin-like proprotein convertase family protein
MRHLIVDRAGRGWIRAVQVLCVCAVATAAVALPPPPANDTRATAEDLGTTFPVRVLGSTLLASNDVNDTGGALPALDTVIDGPDAFYRIVPTVSATFRFQLAPWHYAPVRSSDRRFALYLMEDLGGGSFAFIDGVRAPGDARPVHLDVALTANTKYVLGVDHDAETHDQFQFTLFVDELTLTNPDDCSSVGVLPAGLPVVVLNDIDGATGDYLFTQSGGRCSTAGSTDADGVDHVYEFTPPVSGDYAIELVSFGFNAVLYVDDSCDPFFIDGCQGASDHSTTAGTSGGKHEFVVVTLDAGTPYYIFVDEEGTNNAGQYALIIDDAVNYEVTEIEPNDTTASASPIQLPLAGGQLVGSADVDYWQVDGNVGDRVYAWVNNGGSSNSTLDNELRFFAADGTTLIEYDDDDGEGAANGSLEEHYFIVATSSATIAGARLTSSAPHFFEVTDFDSTDTRTIHRYRFHVGVEPAERSPQPEIEPNDSPAAATVSGLNYFSGVIPTSTDEDWYAFDAVEGDKVFVAVDGDPERDSTGSSSANSDPNAFHAQLSVYGPDDDLVIFDVDDSNSAQTGGGDFPAQATYFVARQTGTFKVRIAPQSSSSQVGPTETYEVAIFINGEPPVLAELIPPVLTLVPDFANDVVDASATDNQPGDTGICDVALINTNNLQITGLSFTPGDPAVNFAIELVDGSTNGSALVVVTDCAGNTAIEAVSIDVGAPDCAGFNFANRSAMYMGPPLHIADDNDPDGDTNAFIEIADAGLITDVNVTVTIDSLDTGDIDLFLVSPSGTEVELVTDRMSSFGFDMKDTTFDDDADSILPFSSSAAPYTGSWLPEDPAGLAKLNGEQAQGIWKLRVIDDSSSQDFGQTLVTWSLDVAATFPGPEQFAGSVADLGDGGGILSIDLTSGSNVDLTVDPAFVPGDQLATYSVTLIDPAANGTATVTVTDQSENTCVQVVNLNGFPDLVKPANTGEATTRLSYSSEVQAVVPSSDLIGVTDTINVPDSFLVGEVEVALHVDTENQGRMAAKLTHNGETAVLVNRISMDDRGSVGNTKNGFDVYLDDDAPVADDIHNEPSLGTIETLGLHQPDGRGEFFGDGITTDNRDNMLFRLAGLDAAGAWDLNVIDARFQSTSDNFFRRWTLVLDNACGPERYVGTAKDVNPGTGIDTIALAPGASNLTVVASFNPGDAVVDYRVELVDESLPGNGTLEITDLAGNVTTVAINLAAASGDVALPVMSGAYNPGTAQFEGTATDDQPGDTGVATIGLAPYADNLEIVSVTPAGAGNFDFVVGLTNPAANGRGYVRAIDACGQRSYILVEIDALSPVCSGNVGQSKRYFSGPENLPLPDGNLAGVTSDIVVTDSDTLSDVDLTFNITHGFDDDIDLSLTSPAFIGLISDLGSTGNDFIDTTLDDEAAASPPDSSSAAPFTGSFQPEDGLLSTLDGGSAAGTYTLQVVDDKTNDFGQLDDWSVLLSSATFVESYDGRAEDSATYDTGICTIELLPGSSNVALTIDPAFVVGDAIARYTVDLIDPADDGAGTVRVTDCAGNTCEVVVALGGECIFADFDGDDDIDVDDYQVFRAAFGTTIGDPGYTPLADFDGSGAVGLSDYQRWLGCYRDFVGNPLAPPPVRPVSNDDPIGIRPSGLKPAGLDGIRRADSDLDLQPE